MSLEDIASNPTPYGVLSIFIIIIGGGFFKYLTSRRKASIPKDIDPKIGNAINIINREIVGIKKDLEEHNEKITTDHILIDKLNARLANLEGQVNVLRDR